MFIPFYFYLRTFQILLMHLIPGQENNEFVYIFDKFRGNTGPLQYGTNLSPL